jgi:hypothetical protein
MAEKFPGRRRQVVAVQRFDVDRHLSDRLAGVDQIRHLGRAADLADRLGGLDQARVGRHPGERHQRGTPVGHQRPHGVGIDAPLGGVRRTDDLDSAAAREGEIHDLVGGVVRPAGENGVARGEIEGEERLREGQGGALHQG